VREKELREKDILIQDNLIRFSTFLQQQEMRKKKDLDAALLEEAVSEKILEMPLIVTAVSLRRKSLTRRLRSSSKSCKRSCSTKPAIG
jgi:hypothetical protein